MLLRRITHHVKSQNWFAIFIDFIIVVVGVFIGIQVSNWNELKKEQQSEKLYIQNLILDLDDQLTSINDQIEIETKFLNGSHKIIERFYTDESFRPDDEFFVIATQLTARRTFLINDSTYTDLISSGNIKIISDNTKKNKLIKYYQLLERIERIIQNNNTLITDQNFSSVFLKLGYYSPQGIKELNLVNADNLISFETSGQSNQFRKLQQIAESNISDSNMLLLLNVLKQRALIAGVHVGFMKQLKAETEKMIQILKS